jgi:hypothetical protein
MIEAFEESPVLASLGLVTFIIVIFSVFVIPVMVIISTYNFFKKRGNKTLSILIPSLLLLIHIFLISYIIFFQ